jgi:hypothetical protein
VRPTIAGGEHDLGGAELALRRHQAEFAAALRDRGDRTLRKIVDAECLEAGVERTKRAQRIDVTVEWTKAAAGDFRPDQRQRLLHIGCREHLHPVVGRTGLVVHALDQLGALAEFVLAEREMKAAILLKRDIEAGLLLQLGREPAPCL